jgi:hypothetical protein
LPKSLMDKVSKNKILRCSSTNGKRRCLACGTDQMKSGRRYCSKDCRHQINWVLSLSKGLLKTFNARYAAFSFTTDHVILDILPAWSNGVSRFISRRAPRTKPAVDLKHLILESGEEWYGLIENKNSRSSASLSILTERRISEVDPISIKPSRKKSLRLSKLERAYLKILDLDRAELASGRELDKIRAAYKKMAKVYHPDMGGEEEKFKQLNEAHKRMVLWAENPQYVSRKALPDCWSYDGSTNRWSPPL